MAKRFSEHMELFFRTNQTLFVFCTSFCMLV